MDLCTDIKAANATDLSRTRWGSDVVEQEGCEVDRTELEWMMLVHGGAGEVRRKWSPCHGVARLKLWTEKRTNFE